MGVGIWQKRQSVDLNEYISMKMVLLWLLYLFL